MSDPLPKDENYTPYGPDACKICGAFWETCGGHPGFKTYNEYQADLESKFQACQQRHANDKQ